MATKTARSQTSTPPRYTLSSGARARLETELRELQEARTACALEQTDLCGDIADIAELAARDMTLEHFDERIARLRDHLAGTGAVIPGGDDEDPTTVRPGTVIALRFGDEEEAERFVVGDIAERGEAIEVITPSSPLGRALIGSRAGDRVEWAAPRGKIVANIVEVAPLPELLAS